VGPVQAVAVGPVQAVVLTEQITARYPGLTVITQWREWMTPDRVIELAARIGPQMTFDIDHPDGWLAESADALRRRPT
jgi:hypothetical protein